MPARSLLLLLALVATAIFAVLNWSAFTAPTTLSLGVATVEGPLGLIMLGLTGLVAGLFLVYVVYLQTTVILEARRATREIDAQRALADRAEASRFTELRAFLEAELRRLEVKAAESTSALQARMDRLEHGLRAAIEQNGTTLSAYIGELEDRLERRGQP